MKYSYKNVIIFILLVITIIIYNKYTINIESFENDGSGKWSLDLIKRFNTYQQKVNKNVTQFNLDVLQKQATPDEVEELLKTGYWPWPDDLKKEYVDKVWSSTIIKIDPGYALNYAMTIYNKNAVRELLAWNTKEGRFLLYGGDLGVSDGMPKNMNNTIKCVDSIGMQKKVYTGMNLWNGYMNSTVTTVKSEDIPKEMPGFSFVKGPCNPCVALDVPGDFSCPFKLNVKRELPSVKRELPSSVTGDDSISNTWRQLWKL
jgi:hypothetical protein